MDGTDGMVAAREGRDGSLVGGAMGSVSERRFAVRGMADADLECLEIRAEENPSVAGGGGGGGIASLSLFSLLAGSRFWMSPRSGPEAEEVVVAARATDGSNGARSAADERRRISWCEAMSRRLWTSLCSEWLP